MLLGDFMSSSFLSRRIKRTSDLHKVGASGQVSEYEERFQSLRDLYDCVVVSNTFMIDQGILEKTLEFAPGEWLLSSYIPTGIENVPIFIRADNAENEIEKFLSQTVMLIEP